MKTVFLSFTESDFKDFLAETINSCLKQNHPTYTPLHSNEELLTVQAAAEYLSLSISTIYGLIHKKELPVMKRSKRCYFLKGDLIDYLKVGKKKTFFDFANEADNYLANKKKLNNGNK